MDRPILVAGAPRTGTTWVARVVGSAPGMTLVNEPDNEWPNPFALKAKLPLGQYPVLAAGELAPSRYDLLWERAFAGAAPSRLARGVARRIGGGDRTRRDLWRALCDHANPRVSASLRLLASAAPRPHSRGRVQGTVVVKSVHAPLALEWIQERFRPRLVVVRRHPLNVLASWAELGWGDCALHSNPTIRQRLGRRWGLPDLNGQPTVLARVAWQVGLFASALEAALRADPDGLDASHEDLCLDPAERFRVLFDRLDLVWSDDVERFVEDSNRPGSGYRPHRLAAEQPERWRERLSPEQLKEAWSILSRFDAPWVDRVAADLRG